MAISIKLIVAVSVMSVIAVGLTTGAANVNFETLGPFLFSDTQVSELRGKSQFHVLPGVWSRRFYSCFLSRYFYFISFYELYNFKTCLSISYRGLNPETTANPSIKLYSLLTLAKKMSRFLIFFWLMELDQSVIYIL